MNFPFHHAHQAAMTRAEEPPFEAELPRVWGEPWGSSDEVGKLRRVLVQRPGRALQAVRADAWDDERGALIDPEGRWYWIDRAQPDLERIASEHAGLVSVLEQEGIKVDVAEPQGDGFVKAVYTRDPSISVPGGAIVCRMGVAMRRGEEAYATRTLAALGLPILGTITGTGTLEGGSFIKLRRDLALLGTSIRCNREGAEQLRGLLAQIGMELRIVPIPGYSIHLDLHLAMVDAERALIDPTGIAYDVLEDLRSFGIETIEAAPGEEWGLNLLCLSPGRVLMSEDSPRTAVRLSQAGVEIVTVPYTELQKNGGGVHCSTMELIRDSAW